MYTQVHNKNKCLYPPKDLYKYIHIGQKLKIYRNNSWDTVLQWNTIQQKNRTTTNTTNNTDKIFSERNQTQEIYLNKIQEQAKLIYTDRSQKGVYIQGQV